MGATVEAAQWEGALEAACEYIKKTAGAPLGYSATVVVESRKKVQDVLSALAQAGLSLGIEVMTPEDYLEDRWALYGDGRRFVSDAQRLVYCRRALVEAFGEDVSVGMATLADGVARVAMGQAKEAASHVGSGFAPAEQRVLAALEAYGQRLDAEGLVEPCEAWAALSEDGIIPHETLIIVDIEEGSLPLDAHRCLSGKAALTVENLRTAACPAQRSPELSALLNVLYRPNPASPVQPTGSLQFAFASGVSAQAQLLCDAAAPAPSVIVVTDPSALFDAVSERLCRNGLSVSVDASVALPETALGRLLVQWGIIAAGEELTVDLVCDAAFNSFGSLSRERAFALEKSLRENRLLTQADLVHVYKAELSPELAAVFSHCEQGHLVEGVAGLRAYALKAAPDDVSRQAATAVLAKAEALAVVAERDAMAFSDFTSLLSGLSVRRSALRVPSDVADVCDAPSISIMGLASAAALDPASTNRVVFGNMNDAERPLKEVDTALTTLLAKVGAPSMREPLAHMRRLYHDALSAAAETVVLERSLNDADANPTYPSVLFQETVDPYRTSLTSREDMVAPWNVPKTLTPYVTELAETNLVYTAIGTANQHPGLETPSPVTGEVSSASRALIVLPRTLQDVSLPGMDLSPSQVESYLGCPYNWFVNRRLRLSEPDEEFGPAERGTFIHRVLQSFHEALRARGIPRVTPATLPEARGFMEAVFSERCAEEALHRPGDRYVPADAQEREQRLELLPRLLDFVDEQAAFLPGFVPAYEEWTYGKDGDVHYGHHRLIGSVDRIDVDENGHAVVIDYKTGRLDGYGLPDEKERANEAVVLPRRMQALMYAQVVKRELGLDVVGALYLNPLKQTVAGIYDAYVLGPQDIPGIKDSSGMGGSVTLGEATSFAELLDQTEAEVDRRLVGLEEGEISPNPIDTSVCEYCPAVLCEKRLS